MLQVVVGTTLNRTTILVPENTTLEAAIAQSGIAMPGDDFTLNGVSLKRTRGDLNNTFADLGASGRVTLLAVKQSQNA